jgi:RNA polymerase sigma factor (sigma-70 family)
MNRYIQESITRLDLLYGNLDDEEIKEIIVEGDDVGNLLFYLLYGRYNGLLRSVFLRLSKKIYCFPDAMAELEIHLLANDCASLKKFRGESKFSTWLTTTAHNLFLNKLPHIENLYADVQTKVEPSTPEPFYAGYCTDTLEELYQALSYLPVIEQRIVILKELEGYKPNEIAQLLTHYRRENYIKTKAKSHEVSVSNVYKIKQRAIEGLAKILDIVTVPPKGNVNTRDNDILYREIDEEIVPILKVSGRLGYLCYYEIANAKRE